MPIRDSRCVPLPAICDCQPAGLWDARLGTLAELRSSAVANRDRIALVDGGRREARSWVIDVARAEATGCPADLEWEAPSDQWALVSVEAGVASAVSRGIVGRRVGRQANRRVEREASPSRRVRAALGREGRGRSRCHRRRHPEAVRGSGSEPEERWRWLRPRQSSRRLRPLRRTRFSRWRRPARWTDSSARVSRGRDVFPTPRSRQGDKGTNRCVRRLPRVGAEPPVGGRTTIRSRHSRGAFLRDRLRAARASSALAPHRASEPCSTLAASASP